MSDNFEQLSYSAHAETYAGSGDQSELEYFRNWYDSGSTDLWRHLRMMECLLPFLRCNSASLWLTIGDGQFGTAATYIERLGGNAIASDIDSRLLSVAKDNAMIRDYSTINAESINFDDAYFDYVFCKEAFHHLPRPHLAFYEMLRVSKQAVILSEPADWLPSPFPRLFLSSIKRMIKRILSIPLTHTDDGCYEEVGNYIFTVSLREFEKMSIALNFPAIAYKRFHDVYIEGVGFEIRNESAKLYKSIRQKILWVKILQLFGLSNFNRIQIIIFKMPPTRAQLKVLKELKFNIIELPRNPFIK